MPYVSKDIFENRPAEIEPQQEMYMREIEAENKRKRKLIKRLQELREARLKLEQAINSFKSALKFSTGVGNTSRKLLEAELFGEQEKLKTFNKAVKEDEEALEKAISECDKAVAENRTAINTLDEELKNYVKI